MTNSSGGARSETTQAVEFPPFRLDTDDRQLWYGERRVELRPKSWDVLRYLVEHSGRLLTSEEILDAVWSGAAVTPGTLNQSVRELRRALGDDAREPRFIKTVHGQGFRFIAKLQPAISPQNAVEPRRRDPLVGRDPELAGLRERFEEARRGRRQIVFLTGEAGIGKTSLARAFLEQLARDPSVDPFRQGSAQCVEHYGAGEAYLPALEALDRIARENSEDAVVNVLRKCAPTWLAQMPWFREHARTNAVPDAALDATSTLMLREFCVAVETLSEHKMLVLWLEDLHWSDPATVELLETLARRPEPARLLILVSYRPVEASLSEHSIAGLKRKLAQERLSVEEPLETLDVAAVRAYLRHRFANDLGPTIAELIHRQSEGNPLFLVTLVNHFVEAGLLERSDTGWGATVPLEELQAQSPDSLRTVVELQIDHLGADQLEALEAASVAGETFAAQTIAGALDVDVERAERLCRGLAGWGLFLERAGDCHWPDGTAGEQYRFRHAVLRNVLYERLALSRRSRLHHQIAECLEAGYAREPDRIAPELGLHFDRGGDPARAVPYLVEAAAGVRARSGDREALAYFDRAQGLLAALPDDDPRARLELKLRMRRWVELNASNLVSLPDQDTSLERGLELCDRLGDAGNRAYILSYRTRLLIIRRDPDDLNAAASFADDEREYASTVGDPILLGAACGEAGEVALYRGQLEHARSEYLRCAAALYAVDHSEILLQLGHDPATLALGYLGWASWLRGCADEAVRYARACRTRAEAGGYALNQSYALLLHLFVEKSRGDLNAAASLARSFEELKEEYGFTYPYPIVWALTGWARVQRGEISDGLGQLREGISVSRSSGVRQGLSHLLATLAAAELRRGCVSEGFAAIDEALAFVEQTGERFWEAEIHRLKGELLQLDGDDEAAAACFRQALDVARAQQARSLELRAATNLAHAWQQAGRNDDARSLLSPVYDAFTEGLGTADLKAAKLLLDELPERNMES